MRIFFTAIALAIFTTPASAYFVTGNQLLKNCEGKDMFCMGYVLGVNDTHKALSPKAPMYCLPEEVTGGQLYDVARKFIQNNPEQRHMPASFLVLRAFELAFPCSK